MTSEIDDDRSQDPGRRQMALARSLPLLIFVIVAMSVIALLAFRNFSTLRRSATIYDRTTVVCSGQGASDTAAYSSDTGIHPVVVFIISNDGLIQPDQSLLRETWIPDDVQDLELVLCLENVRTAIRSLCDNSAISNPVGLEAQATLYEAATGRIVADGLLTSDPQAENECLTELPEAIVEVDKFPSERVIEWLEPYVE